MSFFFPFNVWFLVNQGRRAHVLCGIFPLQPHSIMWPVLLVYHLVLILQSEAQSPCLTHPTFREPGESERSRRIFIILSSLSAFSPFRSTEEPETTWQYWTCILLNICGIVLMTWPSLVVVLNVTVACQIEQHFLNNIMKGLDNYKKVLM